MPKAASEDLKNETNAELKPHRKRNNSGNCSFCGRFFSQVGNLNRHEAIKHRGVRLQCDKCPLLFRDKRALERHGWRHGDSKFSCPDCGEIFKHQDTLKNHIRVAHENLESLLSCTICKKDFTSKVNLRKHKRNLHEKNLHEKENKEKEKWPCEQCGKIKESKQLLQDHIKRHNQHFPCQMCGKVYKCSRSLIDHEAAVHKLQENDTEGGFPCDYCGKKKATKSLLKTHLKRHNGWNERKSERGV